jgi:hypothetical protein
MGLSGCLRLTNTGSQTRTDTPTPTDESTQPTEAGEQKTTHSTRTEETASDQTQTSVGDAINTQRLEISSSDTGELTRIDSAETELSGRFEGDQQLFKHQIFARYAVEITENGEVVDHTIGQIFGTDYRWRLAQTTDEVFITRQPGIQKEWPLTFVLGDDWKTARETTREPETTNDGRAFVIDKTAFDVDPGLYEWQLSIGDDPVYLDINSGFGYVVSIGNNPNDRTRQEAINYVTDVSNGSSESVGSYDRSEPTGIRFSDSTATRAGTVKDDTVSSTQSILIEPTQDRESISIGNGRTLRIRNLATGTTVNFRPS